MKKNDDNSTSNEVLYKDVVLLDRILRGEWKGTYKGYSNENIDRVVIYAEFDMEYKFVHSRMANGCYISKDEKTGKEIILSYDEYLKTIRSMTETNIINYRDSDGKPIKKGYLNSPLKNKVNTAFQILYHIIDGADLESGAYSEYESIPEPKEPENGTKLDYKIFEINHEEWREEQVRLSRKRELVIKKEIKGKGPDRKIYYKYLYPMGNFIKEHFRQKNVKNILNTSSKESLNRKNEIINALVSDRNHDLIQKIRQIETEIGYEPKPDYNFSITESTIEKYKTALQFAMQLGDPNEIASLLVCYMDYLNQANIRSYSNLSESIIDEDDESTIINECISVIQQNTTKSLEDIEQSAKCIGSDWMERLEKGFESQVSILRIADSHFLADVLFVYAKICMSIYNYDKALSCLEECRDIYINTKNGQAIPNLITIYTNLAKLHADWNHCDKALENALFSIDCMKTVEISALNKTDVSIFYAVVYNTIANVYIKQYDYSKADSYLDKAFDAVAKENGSDPLVLSTQLMVSYNICALEIMKNEFSKAAVSLELVFYKSTLLYAMKKTEKNLVFKLTVQSALANAQMHIGNFEDAEDNAVNAMKEYDQLYEQNPTKYAVDRLLYMQRIADIYDAENNNNDSEKLYLKARKEAYELIDSGVSIAKTTLFGILTNLSGLYNKIGAFDSAIDITEESIDICNDLLSLNPDYYIIEMIKALNNLSIAYYQSSNLEEALETCQKALGTCEELMEEDYSNPDMLKHYYYKILHDYSVMMADIN